MIYVGIDFSIKSTAVCILKGDKYIWGSFPDNLDTSKKSYLWHKNIMDYVTVTGHTREVPDKKKSDYTSIEEYKIRHADYMTNTIIYFLKEHIGNNEVSFSFEGFSYASKGNAFIDLIAYNTMLKTKLIYNFNVFPIVFSPKTLKKNFSGNGNADKIMMYKSFKKNVLGDDILIKDPLYVLLENTNFEKDLPKPLDDLIDSYAVMKTLENHCR